MKLRLVTWNVWFAPYEMSLRASAMINILQKVNPDVICLQEVTCNFLEQISRSQWITDKYFCSDPTYDGSTIKKYGYGCAILCKRHLSPSFSFVKFDNTEMGRHLITARCAIGDENQFVTFGNVHLESLDNAKTREAQLDVSNSLLPTGESILVGDFNFCSERNYDASLPLENDCLSRTIPSYEDLWQKLKPEQHGFTFDSMVNKMIHSYEQARYDRIMTSLDKTSLKPTSMDIIGNRKLDMVTAMEIEQEENPSPIIFDSFSTPPRKSACVGTESENEEIVFPSDHFGLLAEFTLTPTF